ALQRQVVFFIRFAAASTDQVSLLTGALPCPSLVAQSQSVSKLHLRRRIWQIISVTKASTNKRQSRSASRPNVARYFMPAPSDRFVWPLGRRRRNSWDSSTCKREACSRFAWQSGTVVRGGPAHVTGYSWSTRRSS